jgi:hypothetical protein
MFTPDTDLTKNPIEIEEGSINEIDFSVAPFGRIRLEYGERLNQNMLNILENFAVGMDTNLILPTPTPMPSFSPTPTITYAHSWLVTYTYAGNYSIGYTSTTRFLIGH